MRCLIIAEREREGCESILGFWGSVVREWSEMTRDVEVVPVPVVDPQAVVAVKKKSSRSWVLLDSTGQATVLDVDKYAIMHRVHIHARDLRIVDPLLSYPSTILGRDRAIVLNLEVQFSFPNFGFRV